MRVPAQNVNIGYVLSIVLKFRIPNVWISKFLLKKLSIIGLSSLQPNRHKNLQMLHPLVYAAYQISYQISFSVVSGFFLSFEGKEKRC